ncbi:helix-turn-helix transcriptional regulator [Brachybacterium horti]
MRMTQETSVVDDLVRKRLRALRLARGLSLGDLAERTHLSPATLSRLETGSRRLALDQLVLLSRALDTSLDQLVATEAEDVVIAPVRDHGQDGGLRWTLRDSPDTTVLRRRFTAPPGTLAGATSAAATTTSAQRAHPGREWLLVLSGTALLHLGTRSVRVERDHVAEFPTMLPHALGAADSRPCEVVMVFDREARRAHPG